jgi:hypothetical protein
MATHFAAADEHASVPTERHNSGGQVEPCPACGSVEFNPRCPRCAEVREQCLLLGFTFEG